jgi:biotin/methionine sulfoxide reductase
MYPTTAFPEFALGHWGLHEVVRASDGSPILRSWRDDPDPSPIGLDQLSPEVDALRVRRPAFREGWLRRGGRASSGRGQDRFIELSWDEAIDIVASELKRVTEDRGNDAIYGGSYGWASAGRFHHAQSQMHRFLNVIGGYVQSRDSYSFGAGSVIMPRIVAPMEKLLAQHTDWNTLIEHTGLFVAFGGLPLRNTQITSGGPSRHRVRAALRTMASQGAKFVNVSPLRQDIEVEAEWMPIRPNTDVALMLALSQVLVSEGRHDQEFLSRYCVGFENVLAYLSGRKDGIPKTPQWAEGITGVPQNRIRSLAIEMADARTMLNASWSLQRQSHGEQSYWALVTLASLLGQIGLPGGGFGIGYGTLNTIGSPIASVTGPRLPQGKNPVAAFIPVARITDMLLNPGVNFTYDGGSYYYPEIALIYWAGGNPFHHHQDLNRFIEAWRKPETIIVHEQFWTSTAKAADIVLPASTALEREDLGFANREGQLVAMHKLREPVGDSKSDYDIFAAIAEAMGRGEILTEGRGAREWLAHMYEEFRAGSELLSALPSFEEFWKIGRIELPLAEESRVMLADFRSDPDAAPLRTPSRRIELFSQDIASFGYEDCPGHASWIEPVEWLGSEKASLYPLHLLSQEPRRRLHSQLDHSAHSRAGKVQGREPVLLNSADARQRGIRDGDLVRIFNDRGACLAAAKLIEDLLPGVAIMATGAWFDPTIWDPSNPLEKHGNPNAVSLDVGSSSLAQATVAQSCLVDIERYQGELPPIKAFELPDILSPESETARAFRRK